MIEVLKQAREAINKTREYQQGYAFINDAAKALDEAIKDLESQKPVAFKIYKPTPPRHAIPNVRDAELPWVYDQDPSSGNVASMWVTPVKHTHPPQRTWLGLTPEEFHEACWESYVDPVTGECSTGDREYAVRWTEAKLKEKNT